MDRDTVLPHVPSADNAHQDGDSRAVFGHGPTEDEESKSYEIGIKSDWLNQRLRLNAYGLTLAYQR